MLLSSRSKAFIVGGGYSTVLFCNCLTANFNLRADD